MVSAVGLLEVGQRGGIRQPDFFKFRQPAKVIVVPSQVAATGWPSSVTETALPVARGRFTRCTRKVPATGTRRSVVAPALCRW